VTVIFNFKFAIFDQGKEREELTAKNAKNTKGKTSAFVFFAVFAAIRFGLGLVRFPNEQSDQFGLKNHPRKSLIVNGVKPVSNRVKPLYVWSQGNG
jgi:hypothetical protein